MQICIKNGRWRGSIVSNEMFTLDKPEIRWMKEGSRDSNIVKPYVLVVADGSGGLPEGDKTDTGWSRHKIFFDDPTDIEVQNNGKVITLPFRTRYDGKVKDIETNITSAFQTATEEDSDESIKERMAERFKILYDMSQHAGNGNIKGLVVYGAPGVGKSYGVEHALAKDSLVERLEFDPNDTSISSRRKERQPNGDIHFKPRYRVIKGHVSAVGLYRLLWEYSDRGETLVFDDCDSVLLDEVSLNLLKTALDSSEKRVLNWIISDRRDNAPNKFEYYGSVIFITNINFEKTVSDNKSKLAPHLDAIMSRCLYLDLTIDTKREKLLRIEQVCKDYGMLHNAGLDSEQIEDVLGFVAKYADNMRELSLRKVLQVADIRKTGDNWERIAQLTCLKHTR